MNRPPNFMTRAKFSPDGKSVWAGTSTGQLVVWDLTKREAPRVWPAHKRDVTGLSFCDEGKWVASASYDQLILLWNGRTLSAQAAQTIKSPDLVRMIAVSHDGQMIASGHDDHKIRLWKRKDGSLLHTLDGHRSEVSCLDFSTDDRELLSGGDDESIRIWNLSSGKAKATFSKHPGALRLAAYINARSAISAGGSTIQVWDISSRGLPRILVDNQRGITAASLSADHKLVAAAGLDRHIRIWDVAFGKQTADFGDNEGYVFDLCFSPDGRKLLSAGGFTGDSPTSATACYAFVWDLQSMRCERVLARGGSDD
jgi:hypothetical protein